MSILELLFPPKEVHDRAEKIMNSLRENYDYDPLFRRYTPKEEYIKSCRDEIIEAYREL